MICSILVIVLTRILQGPITETTPLIIRTVVLGEDCLGCTEQDKVTVDPSTIPQLSQPTSAIHEPVTIPENAAATSTTQGFDIPPTGLLALNPEFSMGSRTFDPSDPFSIPPGSFMRPDESNALSLPSISGSFPAIVPPFTDFSAVAQVFDPTLPGASRKRVVPSGPAQDQPGKCHKLGADVVDPFILPMPGPSLEHPHGISPGAYIELINAKVVTEHDISTIHP